MTTKTTKTAPKSTVTAAEKRVIKAEIATHKRALRKLTSDSAKELKRLDREAAKLARQERLIAKSHTHESIVICRRIAILQGRLGV